VVYRSESTGEDATSQNPKGASVPVENATARPRARVGIVLALAAAAAFSLSNTSANLAYIGGSNALTVAAVRFLLPAAALLVWLRFSHIPVLLPPREGMIAVSLGIASAFYNWAVLAAFSLIPFALAVLIFYLFPLLAALIVAMLGWERLSWKTVAALLLAFVGLAMALKVRGENLNALGVILALLAALGLAIVLAVSGRLFAKHDPRPLTLYMAAVASVLLLLLCAATGDFALPKTHSGWFGFLASAAFYGFAMIGFFIAISMIGSVRASLLSYADAVISAVLGVVVLGQGLTIVQGVGIALVIVALVVTTLVKRVDA
jgi:drug/metabolite transporter (DMT)-like permease